MLPLLLLTTVLSTGVAWVPLHCKTHSSRVARIEGPGESGGHKSPSIPHSRLKVTRPLTTTRVLLLQNDQNAVADARVASGDEMSSRDEVPPSNLSRDVPTPPPRG